MSKLLIQNKALLITILVIFLVVFLVTCAPQGDGEKTAKIAPPWQITVDAEGRSQVFGLTIGAATLADARAQLGEEYEQAIIATMKGSAGMEIYYSRFRAGGITGKLIVVADVSQQQLTALMAGAAKAKQLDNGSRKYTISNADQAAVDALRIASLVFVPTSSLDEDIVRHRFGEPAKIIALNEQQQHFLYPLLGLDILIDQKGKEMLQYVAPDNFAQILAALTSAPQPVTD